MIVALIPNRICSLSIRSNEQSEGQLRAALQAADSSCQEGGLLCSPFPVDRVVEGVRRGFVRRVQQYLRFGEETAEHPRRLQCDGRG